MAENSTTANTTTSIAFGYCLLTTYLNQRPTGELLLTNTVKCTVNWIISIVTVINNLLFIRAYTKFRQLRCISNRLLVYLASSDFLVGALAVPLYITRGIMELYGKHNCVFFNIERFAIVFLSPLSFFLLLLVSCERFVAVLYSIKYNVMCTEKRVTIWFLITLLACLLFILILIWNLPLYYTVVGVVVCLTVAQILVIYWKIYRAASSQRNRMFHRQASLDFTSRHWGALEHKAEKTIAYILGFMLLCYAPALGYVVYALIARSNLYSLYVYSPWFEMLVFFNSACNPFIYCWRVRRIRQSVLSLLPMPCRRLSTVTPS